MNRVDISICELNKLKVIGSGKDAIVYNAGKGYLYKVYRDESNLKDTQVETKLYIKGTNPKNYNDKICYKDIDGVSIYYKDAINKIIDRGNKLQLTKAPISSLYIDNKFSGCVLKKVYGFSLHYIFPLLSLKNKLKVLKDIINEVKELTENYIYPIDLANNPFNGSHSNILIDLKLRPQIIDLDGHSTLYRESFDENLYSMTIASLNTLLLELLYDFEYSDELYNHDLRHLYNTLKKNNVEDNLALKLSNFNADFNDLSKLLLKMSKY